MYCPRCGAPNPDELRFCTTCGSPVRSRAAAAPPPASPRPQPPPPQSPPKQQAQPQPGRIELAGAGPRFAALGIDALVFFLLVSLFAGLRLGRGAEILLLPVVLWGIYYTAFESSPLQGTPGKLAAGIQVVDEKGGRLSIAKAALRYIGKWVAIALAFFLRGGIYRRASRQGLHDIMASSLVVTRPR